MMRVAEPNRADDKEPVWTRVCPVAEILPDTGVCCLVGNKQVAVFRLQDGRVFAIGNYDPFSKANVLSRGIVGDRQGRVKVASPIYKQSFCLATGECLDDPSASVPAYQVRVRDEIVEVMEPITRPLRPGNSGLLSEVQRA
ncbi:MAG TPA: nitrite reductase small subunit NirD [Kofleriaceae bacterium]|nr:nitrite reductase small subunit NirD [Kofleriaceae bacterium]